MKLTLILLLISLNAFGRNLILIGDSHTAGPFGKEMHKNLSASGVFENIVTMGHSSSSSKHWMSMTSYSLSGGIFHQAYNEDIGQLYNPKPIDWRVKVEVPKLTEIIKNYFFYNTWKMKVPYIPQVDVFVIALGANDARSISDENGKINIGGYKERKRYILEMLDLIESTGSRCLWIMPPNAIKKTEANQNFLYKFLEDSIGSRCERFSSNHYKSTGCDGVHFSCASQRPKAVKWALEASEFVLKNI